MLNCFNFPVCNRGTALERYGDISTWDTSNISDMRELFEDRTDFNYVDIMKWVISHSYVETSLTTIHGMFMILIVIFPEKENGF